MDHFNVLTTEKARGSVASLISGIITNVVNTMLILAGVSPVLSTVLTHQVVGNLFTYFLDIMIAKRQFHGVNVSYLNTRSRFRWFLDSFTGPPFHKFIIACIIEAILASAALSWARDLCDRHNIHFKMREAVLAGLVATVTFLLIMNILRFNWVLNETESLTLNIVIIAWMAMSVLSLLLTRRVRGSVELDAWM